MDIKDIRSLIKMITETDICEFEMENAKEKIKIKRGSQPDIIHYQAPPATGFAQIAPVVSPLVSTEKISDIPAATPLEKGKSITSPIVGTFYRAPAPDADPYVEVGQVVEKGQVLCIVEAMKLMNEIEADFRCKIIKICKENAHPVEFADDLFIVEPL